MRGGVRVFVRVLVSVFDRVLVNVFVRVRVGVLIGTLTVLVGVNDSAGAESGSASHWRLRLGRGLYRVHVGVGVVPIVGVGVEVIELSNTSNSVVSWLFASPFSGSESYGSMMSLMVPVIGSQPIVVIGIDTV